MRPLLVLLLVASPALAQVGAPSGPLAAGDVGVARLHRKPGRVVVQFPRAWRKDSRLTALARTELKLEVVDRQGHRVIVDAPVLSTRRTCEDEAGHWLVPEAVVAVDTNVLTLDPGEDGVVALVRLVSSVPSRLPPVSSHRTLASFDLDEDGAPDAAVQRGPESLELVVRGATIPLHCALR
jgi:hypothetical protein